MTPAAEARGHLDKAREFLEAAELCSDLGLHSAATSNAVIAGINSKDAICLALVGRTHKTDDHGRAVRELREAGPAGRALETTLSRLLRLKTRSQYQAGDISAKDAEKAIEWGSKLVEGAQRAVSGR